jgi:hypothetical protein
MLTIGGPRNQWTSRRTAMVASTGLAAENLDAAADAAIAQVTARQTWYFCPRLCPQPKERSPNKRHFAFTESHPQNV